MKFSIRPAASSDIDLLVQFMQEYYAFDHLAFAPEAARSAALEMLDDASRGTIWVIRGDDREIGYAVLAHLHSLEFHGRCALLDEIFLREEARSKGAGTFALEFLIDECRRRGIHALRLEVEFSNTHARSVYEKMGFVAHERSIMTKWV